LSLRVDLIVFVIVPYPVFLGLFHVCRETEGLPE
jgi:hypothetical protein